MSEKICISGLGIVTAIGRNCEETLQSLINEKSGIGKSRFLQTNHNDIPMAEFPLSNEEMMNYLGIPTDEVITRASLLGIYAAKEAIKNSGILENRTYRVGFISGTTVGGMDKSELFYNDFLENDTKTDYISAHSCGACTEKIASYFGEFDFITTISTACSSAANAVLLGANLIKTGVLDAVIVGGTECLTKFHLNGFNTLMILDKNPCRPFDATRAGLTLGEGAAYIVIESEELIKRRGKQPLCYLSGYGNSCDAYHQTASSPEGKGAILAMSKALAMSGLKPSEIDYINAHGTGTSNNDESEGRAIETVFADRIPMVSSTKSFTGHTTSAAGGVESVISILCLQNGIVPANLNFNEPMKEISFKPVEKTQRGVALNHILSNSFGFGGNNTSLIFSKE
ncbi:beta-ACP synthase [Tenuifilaceae bacterium CYCD]|nr:beta-ACP synthase [Tenuifilaceae bacterium CYCD]